MLAIRDQPKMPKMLLLHLPFRTHISPQLRASILPSRAQATLRYLRRTIDRKTIVLDLRWNLDSPKLPKKLMILTYPFIRMVISP